jgi:hypothetical protein
VHFPDLASLSAILRAEAAVERSEAVVMPTEAAVRLSETVDHGTKESDHRFESTDCAGKNAVCPTGTSDHDDETGDHDPEVQARLDQSGDPVTVSGDRARQSLVCDGSRRNIYSLGAGRRGQREAPSSEVRDCTPYYLKAKKHRLAQEGIFCRPRGAPFRLTRRLQFNRIRQKIYNRARSVRLVRQLHECVLR